MQMDAKLSVETFENVMQLAIEGCKAVATYIREVRTSLLHFSPSNEKFFLVSCHVASVFGQCSSINEASSSCSSIVMFIGIFIWVCITGITREYKAIGVSPRHLSSKLRYGNQPHLLFLWKLDPMAHNHLRILLHFFSLPLGFWLFSDEV